VRWPAGGRPLYEASSTLDVSVAQRGALPVMCDNGVALVTGRSPMAKKLDAEQLVRAASPESVTVHVPLELMWDFDRLSQVKKDILGRLGCLSCTSGFDIRWKGVREFVVNPALEIREFTELAR